MSRVGRAARIWLEYRVWRLKYGVWIPLKWRVYFGALVRLLEWAVNRVDGMWVQHCRQRLLYSCGTDRYEGIKQDVQSYGLVVLEEGDDVLVLPSIEKCEAMRLAVQMEASDYWKRKLGWEVKDE